MINGHKHNIESFSLFLFIPCYIILHLSFWFNPCSLSIPITLHSSPIVFLCHLYRTCVTVDRWSIFLAYWLVWLSHLFFSISPLCPRLAELVMQPIDWLAVGFIDPQGRSAGYWQMAPQCPPSLLASSSPSAHFLTCIFLLVSYLSALLNLLLISFHLQYLLLPPLSHSSVHPSIHPSTLPSLCLFCVHCHYRSSMQQRSMPRIMGAGPAGSP